MKASLPEYIGNQALEIINRQGCAAIRITMKTIVFNGKDTHTVGFRDTSDMLALRSGAGIMGEMLPIYVPGDDNRTLGVALQTVGYSVPRTGAAPHPLLHSGTVARWLRFCGTVYVPLQLPAHLLGREAQEQRDRLR